MADTRMLMDLDGQRLPYSLEAEQSVLGAIIIDPQSIELVATQLKPEYFYIPQHREIYKTLSSMFELSRTIDFVTFTNSFITANIYSASIDKS